MVSVQVLAGNLGDCVDELTALVVVAVLVHITCIVVDSTVRID